MTEKKITCCGIRPLIYCISREEGDPYLIHNYDGAVEFPPVTRCFILPFQGPVSYTHLDVYKRQGLEGGKFRLLLQHPGFVYPVDQLIDFE